MSDAIVYSEQHYIYCTRRSDEKYVMQANYIELTSIMLSHVKQWPQSKFSEFVLRFSRRTIKRKPVHINTSLSYNSGPPSVSLRKAFGVLRWCEPCSDGKSSASSLLWPLSGNLSPVDVPNAPRWTLLRFWSASIARLRRHICENALSCEKRAGSSWLA